MWTMLSKILGKSKDGTATKKQRPVLGVELLDDRIMPTTFKLLGGSAAAD